MDFNLKGLVHDAEARKEPEPDIADAKHKAMIEAIEKYAKPYVQRNEKPVYINYKTRKTKLALVLCPAWAPQFPPYNLALLSGVAKTAGYETHLYDVNVKAYNEFKKDWWPNKKISYWMWDYSASWHWFKDNYLTDIHPLLEPILLQSVEEIVAKKPDVVGFTIYDISEEPSKWMAQEIKKRLPNVKIAVGGSNVQKSWFESQPYFDYVVSGEGEGAILDILEEVENGVNRDETLKIYQPEGERIKLNGLPMPDYESIDFSHYDIPNGVNSQFSRGCTAKCTFCEETHFWKYRQRTAVDALGEVEWLYYNKGTDIFWFIDSLVNGNIQELRAFAKGIAAKELKVNWTGYARCDGRMDLEYFKDLKAGGCIMLNYGIETGSQKVLDDMNKRVTVEEMEQNFRHGKEVGIFAATNWIIGFPTERPNDFASSMTLLWRVREMNINNVGAGIGMSVGPETIIGQNTKKYNVSPYNYQGHWIRDDFSMGGTHVMVRVKCFYIFLELMDGTTELPFSYPIRNDLKKDHYKIKFNNIENFKELEYEEFDYKIIKAGKGAFADNLMNEIWPLFRTLWKSRGGFEAEIKFHPDIDLKEFGMKFGPGMYQANYKFSISDDGKWSADFDFKFNQVDNPLDDRLPPPHGRKGAFYAQDYSRLTSNTAIRARKLARPDWGQDGRGNEDFAKLLKKELILNATLDFTFDYHYKDQGQW